MADIGENRSTECDNLGYSPRFCCADGSPVSRTALGTMYFGSRISTEQSARLLQAYVSMGGNQIDTARSYASWLDGRNGTSERAIGAWLKEYGKRETLFIGTKGGLMPRGYNPDRGCLSYSHLEGELQESLDALGSGYVDVFWLHRDERGRPVEEIVDTCNALVCQGLARHIGASNWSAKRIQAANAYAGKTGKHGFSMSQIQFGLGICTPELWGDKSVVCMDSVSYEWYRKADIPLYAYSAQAQGFFSLLLEQGEHVLNEDTRKKYLTEVNLGRARRLLEVSRETGIPVPALVLRYVLTREFETFLILGCSSAGRIKEAFASMDLQVPSGIWDYLTGTKTVSAESAKGRQPWI